jgi:hypothetical protein
MARCFLKGGKGFQGGGAIALARDHPDWSAGHIAYIVEGDLANFHGDTAAARAFYQAQWHDEALKIVEAWKSGDGARDGSSDTATQVKQYQFHRGIPAASTSRSGTPASGSPEEVNWRFYVAGGVAAFISDDRMISVPRRPDDQGPARRRASAAASATTSTTARSPSRSCSTSTPTAGPRPRRGHGAARATSSARSRARGSTTPSSSTRSTPPRRADARQADGPAQGARRRRHDGHAQEGRPVV